jgi:DNA-binding NarL/FixJ family response regulator
MTVRILLGKIGAEWQRTLLDLTQADNELEIVGMVASAMDLLLQVEELKADVVVLSQIPGGEEPGICSHITLEYPDVTVLLLPGNPRRDALWRMVLRKDGWRDASQEILRTALKS